MSRLAPCSPVGVNCPQSLFVGENETDESHHSMILDVDQDLRLVLRTDADYAQTTWNGYSTKFAQPRSATPVRRMYYPTPASEPAGYVELATVSLDYTAPYSSSINRATAAKSRSRVRLSRALWPEKVPSSRR